MVRLRARQRLDRLILPAIEVLGKVIKSGDLHAMVRASQMVLDRLPGNPEGNHDLGEVDATPSGSAGNSRLQPTSRPFLPPLFRA